jgi:hypothetical protein
LSVAPAPLRRRRAAGKQPRCQPCLEIEDRIADRHTAARPPTDRAEDAEGQVLYRKLGMAASRDHPALAPWIMGFVDHAHN